MYGGTFKNPQKDMLLTCHTYEQEFGDIQGLPAQNDFTTSFKILEFENVNGHLYYWKKIYRSCKIDKLISYKK